MSYIFVGSAGMFQLPGLINKTVFKCVLSGNQENHITGEGTNIAVSLVYFT